jgi:hypothetical protein
MKKLETAKDVDRFVETVKGAVRGLRTEEFQLDEQALGQRDAALRELAAFSGDELLRALCRPDIRKRIRSAFM